MAITIFEPVEVRPFERIEGVQKIYRFNNATGASVIKGTHTYGGEDGLWEVAPVYFIGASDYAFELFYPNEVCPDGDVCGWCDDLEVEEKLKILNNLTRAEIEKAIGSPPFVLVRDDDRGYFDRSDTHKNITANPNDDTHKET